MAEFKFFFVTLHPVKAINMEMTYKKRMAGCPPIMGQHSI
jgi:hypothetical protein